MAETLPFEDSKLHQEFQKRANTDRRLTVLVVAENAATGVGKTALAVSLCKFFDPSWNADNRATLDPEEYISLYRSLPRGSALLFDEIGAAMDNRRSMSKTNVNISHDLQTLRVRQINTVATVPTPSVVDKRLNQFTDFSLVITERGRASVYAHETPAVGPDQGKTTHDKVEELTWPPLDDDEDFQRLDELKHARYIEGRTRTYEDEPDEDELSEKERRNNRIEDMADAGIEQQKIADAVEVSESTVSRVLNGD